VCCSVLQCVAVCCSVLQCVAVCCSVLQCVAMCCSVLQCVAVPRNTSGANSHWCNTRTVQHDAFTRCNTLQHILRHTVCKLAPNTSQQPSCVLQYVLQCVAPNMPQQPSSQIVCCSMCFSVLHQIRRNSRVRKLCVAVCVAVRRTKYVATACGDTIALGRFNKIRSRSLVTSRRICSLTAGIYFSKVSSTVVL